MQTHPTQPFERVSTVQVEYGGIFQKWPSLTLIIALKAAPAADVFENLELLIFLLCHLFLSVLSLLAAVFANNVVLSYLGRKPKKCEFLTSF